MTASFVLPEWASHREARCGVPALRALAVEPTQTRARRFVAIRALDGAAREWARSVLSITETAKDARRRRARAEPLELKARGRGIP